MFSKHIFLLLIFFIPSILGCVMNRTTAQRTWTDRLATTFYRKYHWFLPCPNEQMDLNIQFMFHDFHFDNKEQLFLIKSSVLFQYENRRLKWDPKKYDNLETVTLNSRKMWTPFVSVFNGESRNSEIMSYTPARVTSTGSISFTVVNSDTVECIAKLTNWPYDVQSCEAEFGPMYDSSEEVKLKLAGEAIDLTQDDSLWYLKHYEQREFYSNKTDIQLKLLFVLERRAGTIVAMVIYPAYVLTILTLLPMLLEVTSQVRFGIACFRLLNHLIFIKHIALLIPKHSYDSPALLLLYLGSVILTVLCVLITLCLRGLCKKNTSIRCVDNLVNLIQSSRAKFIFLWWYDVKENKWIQLANILNSVVFYVFVLVYFCLFLVLMPKPDNEVLDSKDLLR
ncbi:hypothetical protein K1T71_013351 [Dendrolimus kikuchii]|uniref:Uncharacterized protein n=1 Tax=Dendrolimus kikuchii TaxID=765133 RepID=A0ACC1CHV6_9NEOP|nr:hypothetical protein K1T71_013351 [Dendrolimus kikuchii]